MPAAKETALGSIVKVDDDEDLTFTTVGLTKTITPPTRKRARIDNVDLSDTLATDAAGIEEKSDFSFEQYWTPGDTDHELIDTLFGSAAAVPWQVIYPLGTPVTDEFDAIVVEMTLGALQSDGMIMRTVTCHRTTAIART